MQSQKTKRKLKQSRQSIGNTMQMFTSVVLKRCPGPLGISTRGLLPWSLYAQFD